jgi:hypothetical protein
VTLTPGDGTGPERAEANRRELEATVEKAHAIIEKLEVLS